MSDGTKKPIPMDEHEKKVDADTTEADIKDTKKVDVDSEDVSKDTSKDDATDWDAELEQERKSNKPDPKKAVKAFKDRKEKREEKVEEVEESSDDGDRPLTRREIEQILADNQKVTQETQAFTLAKSLAGSEKEAQVIVEKWKNRSFPTTLSLSEQLEEAYAITHRKKLIGERNEALRALKGKDGVSRDAAGTHRDSPQPGEPKLSETDALVIKQSGFIWNGQNRRYEKKLANGSTLYRDSITKQTHLIRA